MTPAARRENWADAVSAAVGVLYERMADPASPDRFAAAHEVIARFGDVR